MIGASELASVLEGAQVLEQVPSYVAAVSGLEPHLLEGHVLYRDGARVVLLGYPLEGAFSAARFEVALAAVERAFAPSHVTCLVPEVPAGRHAAAEADDLYHRIALEGHRPTPKVANMVRRAAREAEVRGDGRWGAEHARLVRAFLRTHALDEASRALYGRIGIYVGGETVRLLEARDARGRLVAFDVVETAARRYDFHAFAFRDPRRAPPGAADLLFAALLDGARARGKAWVGLGLGAAPGVAFFKRKWGAVPYLRHRVLEIAGPPPRPGAPSATRRPPMGLRARFRRMLDRIARTPSFAEEGWVRDWEQRRVFRFTAGDGPTLPDGFEAVPAASTLPAPDTDALDAPVGIERAVCADDPRCCVYVREDGAVFPCARLAARGEAALGRLPDDTPEAIWNGAEARRFREAFSRRSRVRDHAFFQIIGGSRTLYERNLRLAAEALPPPPAPCRGCPLLEGGRREA